MRERLQPVTWRRSSRSSHTNRVEVALSPEVVAVRDSKDRHGPVLTFSAAAFLAGLKRC
ncbi:DUF397 domain-containing protein [Saccharopolyspora karakumensis]|uniref:DUF397 domain-containing protein n=2 Tax=Saccharopolyspora karakumensis TaxID=2530386 RepID=A0A4R5C1D6_9PSEU|nr:DUF397 domain-containing protein [Saccharopolyspora karakumensis]